MDGAIEFNNERSEEDILSFPLHAGVVLEEEDEILSKADRQLFGAVRRNDAAAVQQALRSGAKVNAGDADSRTPLCEACVRGYNQIIRILLDAGAYTRCKDLEGETPASLACRGGHLSAVKMIVNRDIGLVETGRYGLTRLLLIAINGGHLGIFRFLLDRGADVFHTADEEETTLMIACQQEGPDSLEIVRLILVAGVDVNARDTSQRTALHHAIQNRRIEALRLILNHNANFNIFAKDKYGTLFDVAVSCEEDDSGLSCGVDCILEYYGNKIRQEKGRLALHFILLVATYSFREDSLFHPPLNPLKMHLLLGDLNLKHFRTLLLALDTQSIRKRDGRGRMPIHIACSANAPVEMLSMLVEIDPATLRIADHTGALPIHLLCCPIRSPTEYGSVRYLVEQRGVGALAARNRHGALPLHLLCGSIRPALRTVQFLIRSFPESVTARTNVGQYPFMVAACKSSSASLSVIYELIKANPSLVIPIEAWPENKSGSRRATRWRMLCCC